MLQWKRWLPWCIGLCSLLLVAGSFWFATRALRAPYSRAEAASSRAASWPLWTNPGTKLVPIFSAGSPGVRLGLAQVSGPKTLVTRVLAVMQVDGDFNSVRAKIFVPSDSVTSLRRVQGTAVTALVQYRFFSFSSHKAAAPAAQARRTGSSTSRCPSCSARVRHDNGLHKGWYKNGKSCDRARQDD